MKKAIYNLYKQSCPVLLRNVLRGAGHLVSLIAVAVVVTSCITEGDDEEASKVKVGDKVPAFSVVMNDGSTFSTNHLGGVWTMIVFFNTSCSDCQRELPRINAIYEDKERLAEILPTTAYGSGRVVCIAREETEEDIMRFWREKSLSLPYSAQPDRRIYSLFARSIIPRQYIVDPEGVVVRVLQ